MLQLCIKVPVTTQLPNQMNIFLSSTALNSPQHFTSITTPSMKHPFYLLSGYHKSLDCPHSSNTNRFSSFQNLDRGHVCGRLQFLLWELDKQKESQLLLIPTLCVCFLWVPFFSWTQFFSCQVCLWVPSGRTVPVSPPPFFILYSTHYSVAICLAISTSLRGIGRLL